MTTKPETGIDQSVAGESADAPVATDPAATDQAPATATPPVEVGGRDGPDPTRYGDWEKNGRCIDF